MKIKKIEYRVWSPAIKKYVLTFGNCPKLQEKITTFWLLSMKEAKKEKVLGYGTYQGCELSSPNFRIWVWVWGSVSLWL